MYGQMTAGSWIYIGSQGIVQGTYETFVEAGRQHYGGDLAGRWILTAGLGGMGGAQPLAATFAGASSLNIECQQSRIDFRLRSQLPRRAGERPRRRARAHRAPHEGQARGLGRPARQRRRAAARAAEARAGRRHPARPRHRPDLGARPRQRLPAGRLDASRSGRRRRPSRRSTRALRDAAAKSCATHVQAMLDFQTLGIPVVDYGNNIRQVAFDEGVADAFAFPGFVPAYIRPLFCRGKGPFRWVALSGDPDDIRKTDAKMKELFPRRHAPAPLARHGRASASPSRACRRASAGSASASAIAPASRSTRW